MSAETVRDVYLAGETFELKVTAADAEGKPVEQPLTVDVLRQTEVDGQQGEVSVGKHELKTAADGVARQTLKLAEGGAYTLRIGGADRFQNTIETEVEVQISDDKDDVRLRILADQHTFKVGDTAQVRVHWREQPALALVTFQGAKILDYQLVRLQTGENKLAVPMTAKLAPNFNLAVAVMTDVRQTTEGRNPATAREEETGSGYKHPPKRFHEASSPFQVERDLKVAVQIQRAGRGQQSRPLRPGDEVQVTVTATDPQGKPVAAELSLALVEQALLSRFPATDPGDRRFLPRRERSAGRPHDVQHHVRVSPGDEAHQSAAAGRKRTAGGGGGRDAAFGRGGGRQEADLAQARRRRTAAAGNRSAIACRIASDPFGATAADDTQLRDRGRARSGTFGGGAYGAGSWARWTDGSGWPGRHGRSQEHCRQVRRAPRYSRSAASSDAATNSPRIDASNDADGASAIAVDPGPRRAALSAPANVRDGLQDGSWS